MTRYVPCSGSHGWLPSGPPSALEGNARQACSRRLSENKESSVIVQTRTQAKAGLTSSVSRVGTLLGSSPVMDRPRFPQDQRSSRGTDYRTKDQSLEKVLDS